jgi:TPR repeat protein
MAKVGLLARLQTWSPQRLNFVHMAAWIALFSMMWTTGFVGGRHPGSDPQFWLQACQDGRRNGCRTWAHTAGIMCQYDSASACFQLGTELSEGRFITRDAYRAGKALGRACDLGNLYGCLSLISLVQRDGPGQLEQACTRKDGESCFILASLYHAGQGVPKSEAHAADLYRASCENRWWRGCGRLAESYRRGQGVPVDLAKAIENFDKACMAGQASSCVTASEMYRAVNDRVSAEDRLQQACQASTRYAASKAAYFASDTSPQFAAAESYCASANH